MRVGLNMISAILKRSAPISIILSNPEYEYLRIKITENSPLAVKSISISNKLDSKRIYEHLLAVWKLIRCGWYISVWRICMDQAQTNAFSIKPKHCLAHATLQPSKKTSYTFNWHRKNQSLEQQAIPNRPTCLPSWTEKTRIRRITIKSRIWYTAYWFLNISNNSSLRISVIAVCGIR